MYGVILIAAMATTQSAPDLGWKSCRGCNGCSGCSGCRGCRGCSGCSGCGGCCGGWESVSSSSGAVYPVQAGDNCTCATQGTPGTTIAPPLAAAGAEKVQPPKTTELVKKETSNPDDGPRSGAGNRARVSVSLPADGKLFIDGQPIPNVADGKVFQTPELRPDREYTYEIRAEVVVDGKVVSRTRHVTLSAGDVIRADFSTLGNNSPVAANSR